jgi:predicted secreted acid phosphatase
VKKAAFPAVVPILDIYKFAKSEGFSVFFISGRSEATRAATEENLHKAGYDGWDGLRLRPADDHQNSVVPFKSGQRQDLVEQGYVIVADIGDQESDLIGGWADKTFKLPNPAYFLP